MTLCKFYQQGYCKFGSNCRFEHPGSGNTPSQSQNRFGALQGVGGGGARGGNQSAAEKYNISAEVIERDLTTETPQWILSSYAPGRDAPEQLFGGYPREQSFEEMRLHYVTGKATGKEQEALNQAQSLYQNAQQQQQNAVRNVRDGIRFILESENKHPNRQDICAQGTQGAPFGEFLVGKRPKSMVPESSQANPFGTSSSSSTASPFGGGGGAQTTSSFGQASSLGQRPNPFGTPAFGQPSQPASGFGQASQPVNPFGQQSQAPTPFGQAAQPAQQTPAFGQPSQPSSGFGQPSALGARPSPFGTPAFGQASQPSAQNSAFGQASQQTPGSAFGQPSQLGQKPNPFASTSTSTTSPFASVGTSDSNAAPANPFGAPSSDQTTSKPNPFATDTSQPTTTSNPFGQPAQPSPSPFGQPAAPASNPFATGTQGPTPDSSNPFAQKKPESGGFASQTTQPQTNGAFGQPPASNPFAQSTPTPFGQPSTTGQSAPNPFAAAQSQAQASSTAASNPAHPYPPGSTKQHPPVDSYSSRGMDGRLTMFKGKSVAYKEGMPGIREFDGTWRRIWFPDGPPGYYKDTEVPMEQYDEKSKVQWASFAQSGTFQDALMPQRPPLREWTRWDF